MFCYEAPFFLDDIQAHHKNINITSNEKIKGEDWCLDIKSNIIHNNLAITNNSKKIILTTDQDLIKDGVQAIDDEFLEWFVKNPSCKEVEVKYQTTGLKNGVWQYDYKIIIPKEEPKIGYNKQETLEEAAREYYKRGQLGFEKASDTERAFLKGAKWQQERSYSEEDMREAFKEGFDSHYESADNLTIQDKEDVFIEQFKKK